MGHNITSNSDINMRVRLLIDRIDQNNTSLEYYFSEDRELTSASKDIARIYLDDMEMCLDNIRKITNIKPITFKGE